MPQTAISLPEPTSLHAEAEEIAVRLVQVLGGNVCYLSLSGNAGQKPRLLLAVGDDQTPLEFAVEISPLLRRSQGQTQPFRVDIAGFHALVLPLVAQDHQLGAAVVLFRDAATIHVGRAAAAAAMTASALDSMRRFAAVQVQAEEIVERARTREIQVSRNLIRGVIDSIPMGLVLLDADGTVLAAKPGAVQPGWFRTGGAGWHALRQCNWCLGTVAGPPDICQHRGEACAPPDRARRWRPNAGRDQQLPAARRR